MSLKLAALGRDLSDGTALAQQIVYQLTIAEAQRLEPRPELVVAVLPPTPQSGGVEQAAQRLAGESADQQQQRRVGEQRNRNQHGASRPAGSHRIEPEQQSGGDDRPAQDLPPRQR